MSVVQDLFKNGLIKPPRYVHANISYETIMGSEAYGCADTGNKSDTDIYGFCIPDKGILFPHTIGRIHGFGKQAEIFNVWQQHHIVDKSQNGMMFDLSIYSIVQYFNLCMDCNPNMVDSLFTPERCVVHRSNISRMVRDRRKLFLHKKAWHTFRGYAHQQHNKMLFKGRKELREFQVANGLNKDTTVDQLNIMLLENQKTFVDEDKCYQLMTEYKRLLGEARALPDNPKRAESVEKYGYDCYAENETEFLTACGWKRYDDVSDKDMLATVTPHDGNLEFQNYSNRIDKRYSGMLYTIEPSISRVVVTSGHNMLVSPAHRSPATNYSYDYDAARGDWGLTPISNLRTGSRSWFHVRRAAEEKNVENVSVDDSYLKIFGLVVSDGTFAFRDGKLRYAKLTQSKPDNGFAAAADSFDFNKYEYNKETVWTTDLIVAKRLLVDMGHGSRNKRLPSWAFDLSHRQAKILWDHAMLGDGTKAPDGDVYYTANKDLADDMQAMWASVGGTCSVRGPYDTPTPSGVVVQMYQVYYPNDQDRFLCVDFKATTRVITEELVEDRRVVCFEVPNGTLVTRSRGKVAIHGNCKFAYHVVRLMNQVEQIMTEYDLDLERCREQLKSIRRGEWPIDRITSYLHEREKQLEGIYDSSKIPHGPDEAAIKQLLLDCLEEHFGSLKDVIVQPDAAVSALNEIQAVLDRNAALLR